MLKLVIAVLLVCSRVPVSSAASLPHPSGKLPIGKTSLGSGGELVLLWYPAQKAGRSGPYISAGYLSKIEPGYYGQSAETIRSWSAVATHATDDAMPRSNRAPLLVFLPGQGIFGFQYAALAEEFASRGYIVAVVDYFAPTAPKRSYNEEDADAATNDMARAGVAVLKTLAAHPRWSKLLDSKQLAAGGHSIGGTAAIAMCHLDHRFRAAIDMDGAPFGEAVKGAVVPTLVLRSKPLYSDADLAKRGRTREQMDKMGLDAAKVWHDFRSKSGNITLRVLSVKGTGHMSFSDSPFVMPDTITRFGGDIIKADRGETVIATCATEFLDGFARGRSNSMPGEACFRLPEIVNNP
jgi:dienelactone hydrolase